MLTKVTTQFTVAPGNYIFKDHSLWYVVLDGAVTWSTRVKTEATLALRNAV